MDLREFLAWFDGYAENIKKQPTPEQWKRIRERIGKLDAGAEAAPVSAKPQRAAKPTNDREWRSQYQGALIEMGLDTESAKEYGMTADVDLTRDPVAAAKADIGPMLN